MSAPDRRGLLDRADEKLSVRRQCALLGVARSGVYRPKKPANDNDLALMRRIDEMYTSWPFLGSRRLARMLKEEGETINRKRVQRLMRQMGIAALGPKPNTSKPAPGHKIYPYLLRGLKIERPNHVWAADITYLPIGRGFLYLVAIIDWAIVIRKRRNCFYDCEVEPRPQYGHIAAAWLDPKSGKRKIEKVSTGLDGPIDILPHPYRNKDEAKRAAEARAYDRGNDTFSGTFESPGLPRARAEAKVTLIGYGFPIDGGGKAEEVESEIDVAGGFKTTVSVKSGDTDKGKKGDK